MPDDSTRLTIRVPRGVVRQLEAHIGPRETLSDVVRRFLVSAVADRADSHGRADASAVANCSDVADTSATADTVSDTAALAATVQAIQTYLAQMQAALAALQAWQATCQSGQTTPLEPTCQTETPEAHPYGDTPSSTQPTALPRPTAGPVLPANRTLGKLCPRGHDYQGMGQSLLRLPGRVCLACDKERAKARRQARA